VSGDIERAVEAYRRGRAIHPAARSEVIALVVLTGWQSLDDAEFGALVRAVLHEEASEQARRDAELAAQVARIRAERGTAGGEL
jgi:hypothetical protein